MADGIFLPSSPVDDQALLHNLPAQATSFVGRSGELREIGVLLAQARLVTLTGAGGVGKTRLAIQAASGLLKDWGDGIWLSLPPLLIRSWWHRPLRPRSEWKTTSGRTRPGPAGTAADVTAEPLGHGPPDHGRPDLAVSVAPPQSGIPSWTWSTGM
jgi:hypothetical protein